MNVLVVVPSLRGTSPAQRFRIEQWAPLLEQQRGFRFTYAPFEDEALRDVLYQQGQYTRKTVLMLRSMARRFALPAQAAQHDVVFLHREAAALGPAAIERLLARTAVPLVYDFDDPLWIPYRSPTNAMFSRLKWPGKTSTICRLARTVIVGNRLLASYASQHSQNVKVVPSTIAMQDYPARPAQQRDQPFTVGWTGSHSTLPFLETVLPALRRLGERLRFRLVVVSHTHDYRVPDATFEVVSRRWNAATEAADLHDIDVGLAPFPDTGWTPWRCHGKVLQYMALGVPVVASPIGIVPDYVGDGVNGYLASTQDDWVDRLQRLAADPDQRARMGAAGRARVAEQYAADVWAPRVGDLLEAAASAPGAAA